MRCATVNLNISSETTANCHFCQVIGMPNPKRRTITFLGLGWPESGLMDQFHVEKSTIHNKNVKQNQGTNQKDKWGLISA